jgi:outer membrane immunogenic protein
MLFITFERRGARMRKLLLATSVLAAMVMAAPVSAADLAVKARPLPPPPVFSWSGCYIGVHVGAGWQVSSFTGGEGGGTAASGIGAVGGAQAGCNAQWRAFVIGFEGEFWGSSLYDREFAQGGDFVFDAQSRNRWDGAISVRSGVAFDRAFVYGKLGVVWGKFDYTIDASFDVDESLTVRGNATHTGVLIGVGFEYALTDNWTTKFEYNYIDYGNKIVDFTSTFCEVGGVCETEITRQTVKERKQLAKLGLNYKFGVGKEPVRARY